MIVCLEADVVEGPAGVWEDGGAVAAVHSQAHLHRQILARLINYYVINREKVSLYNLKLSVVIMLSKAHAISSKHN